MDYQNIVSERIGAVARIRLNRPAVRNAQDRSLLRELDHALRAAEADDEVRVVIIGATGDHFSAGHDLKSAKIERPNPTVEQRWEYE